MTYSIKHIYYAPVHCDHLLTPRASEVNFVTSDHGTVRIMVGSETAEPTDFEEHIEAAAGQFAQSYPEYAGSISLWIRKQVDA